MSEKFTVAGTTLFKGQTKVRFANDLVSRVKNLQRGGHTEIELFELPKEMTKEVALAYLTEQKMSVASQEAIANKIAEYTPKTAKTAKAPIAKVAKTTKAATKAVAKAVAKAVVAKNASIAQKAKAAAPKVATATIVTPVTNVSEEDIPAVA